MRKLEHRSSSTMHSGITYKSFDEQTPKEVEIAPTVYKLYQNFPQTFYKLTRVGFDIPKTTRAKLGIYDVFGREVCILLDDIVQPGSFEVVFNSSDFNLKPGVFMYKLTTDEFTDTKKMFLLKDNILYLNS